MSYKCRLCVQAFEKTKPTPDQRKAFHEKSESFGYAQLYQHIEDVHHMIKNNNGKLVKMKIPEKTDEDKYLESEKRKIREWDRQNIQW